MDTVYLIQEPRDRSREGAPLSKDLSSAQRYGRIIPILSSAEHPAITPGPCMFKLEKALRRFDEGDYICFAGGDPLGLALTVIALQRAGVREAKFLRWERERDPSGHRTGNGFYVPVLITLR